MASDPDQGQDGRQGLDADDAVSKKEPRAGADERIGASDGAQANDRAGASDRTRADDRAGGAEQGPAPTIYEEPEGRAEADDRAGASPAPTIYEESFDVPSYPDDTPSTSFFQDLGYGPASGERRSLRDAIRELPEQYISVITHPTSSVFIAEKEKADWDIVWIQLIGNAVIAGLLGLLSMVIPFAAPSNAPSTAPSNAPGSGIQSPNVIHALNLSATIGLIVFIPLIFFVGSGILRLLARRFGGDGSFLEQCYTTLLFQVPFGVAISVIRLLPFIGGFFFWFGGLMALVYGVVLQILATMAVHHLSGDKATPPVIITVVILIPLTILLFAFLTFIFALA